MIDLGQFLDGLLALPLASSAVSQPKPIQVAQPQTAVPAPSDSANPYPSHTPYTSTAFQEARQPKRSFFSLLVLDVGGIALGALVTLLSTNLCWLSGVCAKTRSDTVTRKSNTSQQLILLPLPVSRQNAASSYAIVNSIRPGVISGLKLASGSIFYEDGDVLSGGFRVYCPTIMIRPIDYTLKNSNGVVKKQGSWWNQSFQAKWKGEFALIAQVCKD